MKQLCILIALISFVGCNKPTPQKNAKEILSETIHAHGDSIFHHSLTSYKIDDLEYEIFRNGNISNFRLTRKRDTATYVTTYKNGYLQYFIDDEEQAEGTYAKRVLNFRLEGFIYTSSLPFVLDQNAVILSRLDDVTIRKKNYLVLHATFTKIEDQPENEFYLYIDPETHLVAFSAENYEYSGQVDIFKRYFNTRTIKGIVFSDYYSFKAPKEDIPIFELYKLYDIAVLKDYQTIQYQNISVELLSASANE